MRFDINKKARKKKKKQNVRQEDDAKLMRAMGTTMNYRG